MIVGMTVTEKIFDWISGGALTRAKAAARECRSDEYKWRIRCDWAEAQAREQSHRAYLMQERLNRIAACETHNANATVRRMARIAREAME